MTKDEALKLALDAFGEIAWSNETQWQRDRAKEAITAIKEALAQPEQEPVAWGVDWGRAGQTPCVSIIKRLNDGRIEVVAVEYGPQRTWVGLTDEEIDQGLVRTKYAMQTAGAWRDGVEWAVKQLQERNT